MTKKQIAAGKIPAYSYDGDAERVGRRLRCYTLAGAEHLITTCRAIGRRNRRGALVAIVFRNEIGGDPMLRSMKPGQKYSVQEHVGRAGKRAWKLTELSGVSADYVSVLLDVLSYAKPQSNRDCSLRPDFSVYLG